MLEKKPFVNYTLEGEEKVDTFTVKLNPEERALLEKMKAILEQDKDSTAIKQLAWIGTKVLLEEKTSYLLETVFDNKRKNKRLGIVKYELQN